MPLVFAESEATESGITYDDRTGISYQYPTRYRRIIQPGERFVYYRGRRKSAGGRAPQVYLGTGLVGNIEPDPGRPNCLRCEILDYEAFLYPVFFKEPGGRYLETGAERRGYFQPGVRVISEKDFTRILEAAQPNDAEGTDERVVGAQDRHDRRPAYASPGTLRAVEEFAVHVALKEVRGRYRGSVVELQPRNNPGFDILVRPADRSEGWLYVEIKGTSRIYPQFFITEGELQFSRRHGEGYRLIVVYNVSLESETYEIFWHEGPIVIETGFRLTPVQWACAAEAGPRTVLDESGRVSPYSPRKTAE